MNSLTKTPPPGRVANGCEKPRGASDAGHLNYSRARNVPRGALNIETINAAQSGACRRTVSPGSLNLFVLRCVFANGLVEPGSRWCDVRFRPFGLRPCYYPWASLADVRQLLLTILPVQR